MAKVVLIVGRVASGKTTYARELVSKGFTLISQDDMMLQLFGRHVYDEYPEHTDTFVEIINKCQIELSIASVRANINVVLDNGFWFEEERKEMIQIFEDNDVDVEVHYVSCSVEQCKKNLMKRNNDVDRGNEQNFISGNTVCDHAFEVPKTYDRIISFFE